MIKTIWVLVAFIGTDGELLNLDAKTAFHEAEYSCLTAKVTVNAIMEDNTMGRSLDLSCRKALAQLDSTGNITKLSFY